jgi:hypothetical protein
VGYNQYSTPCADDYNMSNVDDVTPLALSHTALFDSYVKKLPANNIKFTGDAVEVQRVLTELRNIREQLHNELTTNRGGVFLDDKKEYVPPSSFSSASSSSSSTSSSAPPCLQLFLLLCRSGHRDSGFQSFVIN